MVERLQSSASSLNEPEPIHNAQDFSVKTHPDCNITR